MKVEESLHRLVNYLYGKMSKWEAVKFSRISFYDKYFEGREKKKLDFYEVREHRKQQGLCR